MANATKPARGLKTMQSIKTMGALVDARRMRTTSGALLELSAFANERQRLQYELRRWQRRHAEIEKRLAEIAEKELWLYSFVKGEPQGAPACGKPIPLASGLRRVQARELNY